jgi:hypothetical protein
VAPSPPKRTTVLLLHVPPLHVAAGGHTAQRLPPLPHALDAVPARHCPDGEQHPVQEVGSHALDVVVPVTAADPLGELVVVPVAGAVADPVDVAVGLVPGAGEVKSSAVLPQPVATRVKMRARGEGPRTMALSVLRLR